MLLHVFQELREELGVGKRVAGNVAEDADIAAASVIRRRTICTHRNSRRLSTTDIRPAGAATLMYCAGMMIVPSSARSRDSAS